MNNTVVFETATAVQSKNTVLFVKSNELFFLSKVATLSTYIAARLHFIQDARILTKILFYLLILYHVWS